MVSYSVCISSACHVPLSFGWYTRCIRRRGIVRRRGSSACFVASCRFRPPAVRQILSHFWQITPPLTANGGGMDLVSFKKISYPGVGARHNLFQVCSAFSIPSLSSPLPSWLGGHYVAALGNLPGQLHRESHHLSSAQLISSRPRLGRRQPPTSSPNPPRRKSHERRRYRCVKS